MLFIIDSNEFIFAFTPSNKKIASKILFEKLLESNIQIRIPRIIFEEVKRNLSIEAFQEFNNFIRQLTSVDEDISVPFEIGIKYTLMGLKPADAFIAAYTEWTGADALVTENRHFLSRQTNLLFKILTAESCLKIFFK